MHVSHSVRKLTGVKAHLDCPNPNLVPFYGKTAHVEPHKHRTSSFQLIFFAIVFFKIKVWPQFAAFKQFEHQINGYIWILLSKNAKWGQRAQPTI
jgi:hypothetical protein